MSPHLDVHRAIGVGRDDLSSPGRSGMDFLCKPSFSTAWALALVGFHHIELAQMLSCGSPQSSHILEGEGRDAAHRFIDIERAQGRRRRALRAGGAIAEAAGDPDRHRVERVEIEPLGID